MRRICSTILLFFALLSTGCPVDSSISMPTAEPLSSEGSVGAAVSSDGVELLQLIDQTLDHNLRQRRLSSETHGAWQILHGMLAYGSSLAIETPEGDQPALEYLISGGSVLGFEPLAGDAFPLAKSLRQPHPESDLRTIGFEDHDQRSGLRMPMDPSSKVGQGHRDQWLAILSQCELPIETQIQSIDREYTIGDWLRQAEYDVPRNFEREFSWSLIALTKYFDTNHAWLASDGTEYSTELLLMSEVDFAEDLQSGVCGGTHRLIGIAMALARRRAEGNPITGVWKRAEETVNSNLALAKQNQNPDGTYSTNYLHRTGWTQDLGESLGTTGHVLEFVAIAAPQETLNEAWVKRSASKVCSMLEQCEQIDLECGVLYHALHGLQEYAARCRAQ
ncbi:MAG: ADP-ribosylation factor-directed GTPase activating protein isoform b [Rubripirellula sp.]